MASSSSCAYSVMRTNHCSISRFSTGAPERQPLPSMTCSLASTVWSIGVPVDGGGGAIGQALLHQPREQPLLPAVIVRVAGGQLALPVVAEAEARELPLHVGDVGLGPLRRRDTVFDGGVFRRQAEGVPAHRLEHVLAQHALVASDDVADGVIAHMPHVQPPGRVREHRQAIELLPCRVLARHGRSGCLPNSVGPRPQWRADRTRSAWGSASDRSLEQLGGA